MPNGFLVLRQAPSTHPYTESLISFPAKRNEINNEQNDAYKTLCQCTETFITSFFRAIVLVLLCVQSRTSTNANERLQYVLNFNFKREEVKVLTGCDLHKVQFTDVP